MTKVIIVGSGNDIPNNLLTILEEKGIDTILVSDCHFEQSIQKWIDEDKSYKIKNFTVPFNDSFPEQTPTPIYIKRRGKFKRK